MSFAGWRRFAFCASLRFLPWPDCARDALYCFAACRFTGVIFTYEPFRLDAVKLVARTRGFRVRGSSLGKAADLKDGGLRYALITWDSRNGRRSGKAVGLCKDLWLDCAIDGGT